MKNPILNRPLKRLYFTTSHYKTRRYSKVDSQTSFSADLILMVSLFACPSSCNWPTNSETFVSKRLCPAMISTFPSDLLLPSLMLQPVKSASRSPYKCKYLSLFLQQCVWISCIPEEIQITHTSPSCTARKLSKELSFGLCTK